ncbi:hypothetical protein FB45DRAFT_1050131 [Roridomyces roridus]|uniref:Uncharacterized protein n=1 Tax=Roridomyces roridus TaxID=1738132 RepID=A0AAD7CIN7_9AGAR|nr:hypothetical protein FB45DRAFT_1050131 [Roridomyces roridus]
MFFRKASFLAFSLLSSVQTPKTLQPVEVPEVLPFTHANASFALFNGSLVLAQGPLDIVPILSQIHVVRRPSVSFDLAGTDSSHPASPNIAGFDLASLDEVEGIFTATVALARLLKHKTGVVWSKLAISLLILSGMLAFDALQLGEPRFLFVFVQAGLGQTPAKVIFAETQHRFRQLLSSILQGPLLVVKIKRFKHQRVKARVARQATTRSWVKMFFEAFILALPTVLVLPPDVPFRDIIYALFLNGTIVDLMTRNVPDSGLSCVSSFRRQFIA